MVASKDTISKKYDHTFKDIFIELFEEEYKEKFKEEVIKSIKKILVRQRCPARTF